jgi:hypothetical protein
MATYELHQTDGLDNEESAEQRFTEISAVVLELWEDTK